MGNPSYNPKITLVAFSGKAMTLSELDKMGPESFCCHGLI
jgi:hypothetical protein